MTNLDSDFVELSLGSVHLRIRKAMSARAAQIMSGLNALGANRRVGLGNRHSAFRLNVAGAPELFVRCSRRGGLIRFVLSDLYVGASPRPFRELAVTIEGRRRGIPLADPIGAMVEWVAPMIYRGYFVTRAMPGMTLWEFMRTDDDPAVRAHVLDQARYAIETMYQRGLFHPDLNLHNLFVTKVGEGFTVVIIDLDKAHLSASALAPEQRDSIRHRLARSARKLDPVGRYLDSYALSRLDLA